MGTLRVVSANFARNSQPSSSRVTKLSPSPATGTQWATTCRLAASAPKQNATLLRKPPLVCNRRWRPQGSQKRKSSKTSKVGAAADANEPAQRIGAGCEHCHARRVRKTRSASLGRRRGWREILYSGRLLSGRSKMCSSGFETTMPERRCPSRAPPTGWAHCQARRPLVFTRTTRPLLALAFWTDDQDFFRSGIATWTTDRVELYLTSFNSAPAYTPARPTACYSH